MKGELRFTLMELLKDTPCFASDLFFMLTLPYGTSIKRGWHLLKQRNARDLKRKSDSENKRRFNDLLYHLRKEGLVKENESFILQLTARGKEKLKELKQRKSSALPDVKNTYHAKEEEALKIILFDIPESERRKRAWLRSALDHLGFKMLQKSVWIGKGVLPDQFINDLNILDLLSYVEIFAISKSGSLKRLQL